MRRVRRAVALAALVPCIAMAAPMAPAAPAAPPAAAKAQAQKRAQVGLALTKVSPKTVRANSKIQISGIAKNRTEGRMAGLTLRLRYSAQPVVSRSQLDQYASGQPQLLPNIGPQQQIQATVAPGATQKWTFKTSAKALRLQAPAGTPGVYPVGVEVLNSSQQVVGGLTTFLTLMPKRHSFKPVAVSWVWPLIDRMHRTTDQRFFDDKLTGDVSPDGRLATLVDAAASTDTPITWAIDPALLDDVQRMASGSYTVQPLGKKATTKEKSTAAATWLTSLKEAVKDDPYFTVPYGDPDVVALVRRKMNDDIAVAFDDKNTGVATKVLGREANAHVAWPPYGAGGPGTLEQLAKHALQDGGTFLMSSAHFQNPPTGALPNATTTIETRAGKKGALLYDEKLNKIVSEGSRTAGGALLTEQRFLAETAMIAAEAPSQKRTVVVAPDRHWNPAPGLAENLLNYTEKAAWLDEMPLSEIASADPQTRVFNGYPDAFERYELRDPHYTQIRAITRRAAMFRSVMTNGYNISYDRALLRLESVAWRVSPGRAKRTRNALADQLESDMGEVRIVTSKNKRVLMGGSSGKLPVLVENTLDNQSVKVRLVAASMSTGLRLGELSPEEELIELRPGERAQRWIPAQAAGNGRFRVHLALEIPGSDELTLGSGETITVVATGYGRIALLITGGGLAVLFVGVGVRANRARRRRKAEAAGDGVGPAGTGEQGNGFPGTGLTGPGIPASGLPGTPGAGLPGTGHPPGAGTPPGSATGPAAPGTPAGPATGPATPGAAPGSSPGPAAGVSGPGAAEPRDGIPEPTADRNAAGRRKHAANGDPRRRDRD